MTPTQSVLVDGFLRPCDRDVGAAWDRLGRGEHLPLNAEARREVERARELLCQAQACLAAAADRTLGR